MHVVQMGLAGLFAFAATFVVAWAVAALVTLRGRNRDARADAMRRHPSTQAAAKRCFRCAIDPTPYNTCEDETRWAHRLIAELEADLIIAAQENQQ